MKGRWLLCLLFTGSGLHNGQIKDFFGTSPEFAHFFPALFEIPPFYEFTVKSTIKFSAAENTPFLFPILKNSLCSTYSIQKSKISY